MDLSWRIKQDLRLQIVEIINICSAVIVIPNNEDVLVNIAQWESARPNLDLPKIEARSEVSA